MNETEMPLDASEVIDLSGTAWDLFREIRAATRPDSEGGKQISKAEGLRLAKLLNQAAAQLLADLED